MNNATKNNPKHHNKDKEDTSHADNSDSSAETPERGNTSLKSSKKARTIKQTIAPRPQNHQSLRRQCNRSKNRVTNNRQQENLRTIKTTYTSRITMKLVLPPSNDPLSNLLETLKEMISKLQEATQDNVALIAWKDVDIPLSHALLEPDHLPTSIPKLLPYTPKIFPGKKNMQNTIYVKLHIAHDILFTDIQSELDYWLRSNNYGMYYNMLQSESVVGIGWMLYSLKGMDAGALAEEIYDMYGIEIGLRWRVIDQGLKGKIPNEQRVSALHVESSLEHKAQVTKALLSIYGRKMVPDNEKIPNGINFRFVTLRSSATSKASVTKLDKLRVRQKKFLSNICKTSSWDIVHLDHVIKDNTCSLRTYIMSLTSTEYEGIPLFHSVDLDYNGDGFVFTYLPELQAESESAIHTLLPRIRHKNKTTQTLFEENHDLNENQWTPLTETELQSFFTQEAIDRTEEMYFDINKNCVIDPLIDDNLEFVIDDDAFDQLLGPEKTPHTGNEPPTPTHISI